MNKIIKIASFCLLLSASFMHGMEDDTSTPDQFLAAVSENNTATVQTLLNNGYVIDIGAPFHVAVANRNADMLKLLIDHSSIDIQRDVLGGTFLEESNAVHFRNLSAIHDLQNGSVLIITPEQNYQSSINQPNQGPVDSEASLDALTIAAQSGNIDEIQRLAHSTDKKNRLIAARAAIKAGVEALKSPGARAEDALPFHNCATWLEAYEPPKSLIPFYCGIATAATACIIFYRSWSRKRQLSALEHAAKTAKELVVTISFDSFNAGDRVRGLQERFDVHSILQTIGNEEKRTTLQTAIEQFDTALQVTYDKVMSNYYHHPISLFLDKEKSLVNRLEISFVQLQDALAACRSEFSVGAKGWTALGIGVLATLGFASWAA